MIKTKSVLEVKVGERTYELVCSPDSPLGELCDVLFQMQSHVIEKIKDSQKNAVDSQG